MSFKKYTVAIREKGEEEEKDDILEPRLLGIFLRRLCLLPGVSLLLLFRGNMGQSTG